MEKFGIMVIWLSKPFSIAFFLALYIVFVALIFPGLSSDMQDAPPIDLALTYTVDEVYSWIEAYGEVGRKAYIQGEMSIDIIYPIIYTALFIGLLGFTTSFKEDPRFYGIRWLVISPLIIWFFDLIENIGIVTLLNFFPERLPTVALLTSFATTSKWSCAGFVIAATLFTGGYRLSRTFRKPT